MGDKGTRVFKKASPNGKLTVYLGKRDFVDHIDVVDPVDGVVLVDPEYLKERKVFVTLTCAFRYGREDLDVLGLTFRKDLFVANIQAFPPVPEEKKPLTRLQERLIKKLGEHAYPFTFEVGKRKIDQSNALIIKGIMVNCVLIPSLYRNSVRLVIRKVQYAPERPGPQPMAETTRQFLMSDKPLHLEASLDKEPPLHGALHAADPSCCGPLMLRTPHAVDPSCCGPFMLRTPHAVDPSCCGPFMLPTPHAVDPSCCGPLMLRTTHAADPSCLTYNEFLLSGIFNTNNRFSHRLIGYVSLPSATDHFIHLFPTICLILLSFLCFWCSDVAVELPFTLMHPKPKEEPLHREAPENEAPIDTNLIEFDTNDDDIVFEDFARQRLKGMKDDKEEEDEGTNSPPMNDR
ncbi:beta-arrestin-1-like [Pyxicephalus adspersus]|uniref:beta-arrestin-1-like n=1 Tax=Pyxicephalus adspersus TaxID=30357 RepID=UPI003B5A010D